MLKLGITKPIRKFKIAGMPKDSEFNVMIFGRQIEHFKTIEAFKAANKSQWISKKRISAAKSIKEFLKMMRAKEFYCSYYDSSTYSDDSFEIWYKQ